MILGSFALEVAVVVLVWMSVGVGGSLVSSAFGVGAFMLVFLWLSAAAAELVWQLAMLLTYVGAVHSFLLEMISNFFNLFLTTDC